MAEQQVATGSEAGAGAETQQQAAEQTPQGVGESQSSEQASVGSSSTNASNVERRERSSFNGATRRIVEETVSRSLQAALDARLSPLLEKLERINTPPVPTSNADDTPDYNDLNGWLQRKLNALWQEKVRSELPQTLDRFKNEMRGELKNVSKTQEARNYLISQSDVGQDQQKLEEIEQTMIRNGWHYMAEHDPIGAVKLGYERWKESKKNNAPPKSQLSGISGGAGTSGKREPTLQEIEVLKQRLISNPTMEEAKQIEKDIQALVSRTP